MAILECTQYKVLLYLKDNGIVVVALPGHTSHVLQPLEVTVVGPFKSFLQREVHNLAMTKQFWTLSMSPI